MSTPFAPTWLENLEGSERDEFWPDPEDEYPEDEYANA